MVIATRSLLAALALGPLAWGQDCRPLAPCYTAAGLVNSASGQIGVLAPYTFATIYGTNLSYGKATRGVGDYSPALGGVVVLVNSVPAMVFYTSPTQVNFLTLASAGPGGATIQLVREGQAGPEVQALLFEFAPALFQLDIFYAVGLRFPSYAPATEEAPARPGEYVILFATGLGDYNMPADEYIPPPNAVPMRMRREFQVLLDGVAVDDSRIEYAGSVAHYWGLFQINLKLPEGLGDNPEIRLLMAGSQSPPGLRLPVRGQ